MKLRILGSGRGRLYSMLSLVFFLAFSTFASISGTLPGAQAAVPTWSQHAAAPVSTSLVISQVYGGGGNTGAPWMNDFIELFNPTGSPVTAAGWSVQYASATGSTWQATPFTTTIASGAYFLIAEGGGTNGIPLPAPDITGTINMSSTAGKVALVNSVTPLTCGAVGNHCLPTNTSIVDLVGYGPTATDWEGTGPTAILSNTTSAVRAGGGCVDNDDNATDFVVGGNITPHNSSSAHNTCGPAATPTNTITPGGPTLTPTLTRTPVPPTNTATVTLTPGTPTVTSTPAPSLGVLLYMVHYTSYLTNTDEAVRIINVGSVPAVVSGWQVTDSTGSITLPAGATIPASGKIWIANQAVNFRRLFGFSPDYEYGADSDPSVPQAVATANFNFPDAGDAVRLLDATSANADTMVYKGGNTGTTGWSGVSVQPYLPAGQPAFQEAGQIFYRKLDQLTGMPVPDTNTKDDWAQDDDATGASPTPGREYDDVNGKKLLRPGWALTDPSLEDMFFTKKFTDTNVTSKFLVSPDNMFDAVHDLIVTATQSITIETYEFHAPPLVQDIINAKNRGVRISITIDGNPCCLAPPRPDDETLWSAQQWENAGIPVYFFSGYPATTDDNYRFNNVHAKIMIVDEQWVQTGTDNFSMASMPNDPKGNGTAGSRGALIITNAPDVVAYTKRLVNSDTQVGKYADLVRYPTLGTPPPGYSPTPLPDMTGYTPVKPTPLVVTETEGFEIVQSPDNALRDVDSLIGMVGRAGAGDEVIVEQQYERKYWETNELTGPNPRLTAYIAAAQRGATVRILLDGFFEGGDCTSQTHNPATVAYINGLGLPNLQARVGQPTSGGPVGATTPTTGNIHNKMVLVRAGTQGYSHISSINGSLNATKNNREYGLQVASTAAYNYFKDVFDYDWSVGYIPCGGSTPTATPAGTQTPSTATATATNVPPLACNLLVNSDFETGSASPWYTTTPGVVAQVSTNAHSGQYSLQVTHAFTATGGGSQGVQQDVTGIVAGQVYPVQGYIYRPDNNVQSARVRVAWYNCTDFSCNQAGTSDVFAGNRGVAGWQFFSGSVTAPAGALAAKYRLIFYNANAVDSTTWWDDLGFGCIPGSPTVTATGTSTAVATSSSTATLVSTGTSTSTAVPTNTATYTPTSTNTSTLTVTVTRTGTPTNSATGTATNTFTSVPTNTSTNTSTPVQTNTATSTAVITLTGTSTPSSTGVPPTQTSTVVPTNSATSTGVPGTATATATPCEIHFSDVGTGDWFYTYVRCLYCRGAISGYGDNTFRPYANTTRGQMAKIVVQAFGLTATVTGTPTFNDVPETNPFYLQIETAARNSVVSGYNCGGLGEPCPGTYYRPGANVTRAQLSKIVVIAANRAYGWPIINPATATFNDVPRGSAFYEFIETAVCHSIIDGYSCGGAGEPCPGRYFRQTASATRAQISKIVCQAAQNQPACQVTPTR